ncbi:MAG: hypothetical protein OXB92_05330 [Acidimicrobiaceae bacterium]|nr:hypothetical protein [Acidimicrobiaceae bacterium]
MEPARFSERAAPAPDDPPEETLSRVEPARFSKGSPRISADRTAGTEGSAALAPTMPTQPPSAAS